VLALAATLWFAGAQSSAGACHAAPYDCAVQHVARREFVPAIRLLERLVTASPADLKALNLLGIALTGAGRPEAANARFREALAKDPAFTPSRKNLAINLFDGAEVAEAGKHLEEVLKLAPGDEVANLYLAEVRYRQQRRSSAVAHYEMSGERFSQRPEWILHYGQSLLDAGRAKDALAVLERLPASDPEGLFEAGAALGRAGAHADAARFFARARAGGYKDAYAAAYNQALMSIEAGDHAAAVRVAEAQFAAGTAPPELYNLASRAYLGAGRLQEAYDALRTAARLEPTAVGNYVDLAMICLEHENLDLGMEIVDLGLVRVPQSWLLRLQRGVLLAMKSEFGLAEAEFEAARRIAPDEGVPYAALSMVWMQTGQADKAVEVLRRESARRKGDSVVPYLFAVALQRSGADLEGAAGAEAAAALRASLLARPDFAPARSELGRVLLRRGDTQAAIRELEAAAALDPSRTATLYNLAQAYRKQGDRERAAELLAKVSTLNDAERGDAGADLKRVVLRLVREGTAAR
jgi:tetratricopeptide (TPR) repeat protein